VVEPPACRGPNAVSAHGDVVQSTLVPWLCSSALAAAVLARGWTCSHTGFKCGWEYKCSPKSTIYQWRGVGIIHKYKEVLVSTGYIR
jgi:hypothetical protein